MQQNYKDMASQLVSAVLNAPIPPRVEADVFKCVAVARVFPERLNSNC